MANELLISYPTGATLYALLYDSIGQIWNGSAFAAPGSASWTDYDLPMVEVATATGIYRASMPAAAAGTYGWTVRRQAGGSPAVGDIAVGTGKIEWSGTAEIVPLEPTVAGRKVDVSTTGEMGLDFDNVKAATGPTTLTNITVPTVTTLTGHTAQTGDNYPIVSHVDYGNAKLVRSTTPANTLDVNSAGEAGIDWANVGGKTSTVALTNTSLNSVSGSIGSLGAQAKLDVNAEVDTALNTAIPGSPTADSINERLVTLDAGLSATGIADAVLDEVVEGSYTLRQMMRLVAAALAGVSSGGGTAGIVFTGIDGSTQRIVATVDALGNRTAVTKTVT